MYTLFVVMITLQPIVTSTMLQAVNITKETCEKLQKNEEKKETDTELIKAWCIEEIKGL